MSSVRVRTCAAGAAVAVVAGLLVDHGAVFGSDFLPTALLGLLVGAVLGLVPGRATVGRLGAFGVGVGAAWVGYLLRAGVLPDIPMGRAIAAVVVVSLVTAVATATADRLPLWAGLLGSGVVVGAYEAGFTAAPSDVTSASVVAVTSVVLAAAFGHVVTSLVSSALVTTGAARPSVAPSHAADETESLDITALGQPVPTAPVPGPRVTTDAPTTSETSR